MLDLIGHIAFLSLFDAARTVPMEDTHRTLAGIFRQTQHRRKASRHCLLRDQRCYGRVTTGRAMS